MFSCTRSVKIMTYIHFWTYVIILMGQVQLDTESKPSPYKWIRLRFSVQLHWINQDNGTLFNFYISHAFGNCTIQLGLFHTVHACTNCGRYVFFRSFALLLSLQPSLMHNITDWLFFQCFYVPTAT